MSWTTPRTWSVELVTVDDLNEQIRDNLNALAPNNTVTFADYTPTLTTFDVGSGTLAPTLGTGSSVIGRYLQIGSAVFVWGAIQFGTSGTNAGTGGYQILLPVPAISSALVLGHGMGQDGSANGQDFEAIFQDTTHFCMRYAGANLIFTQSLPSGFWGANSRIMFSLMYEAA